MVVSASMLWAPLMSCTVVRLIVMVVMVFPVAMSAPVVRVPIHHTRLGHHRRLRNDDGCTLHDDRLWNHHRRWLHDHGRGGDHDRHTHPNGDPDPACLCQDRQAKTGHADHRHHTQRTYEHADTLHCAILLLYTGHFLALCAPVADPEQWIKLRSVPLGGPRDIEGGRRRLPGSPAPAHTLTRSSPRDGRKRSKTARLASSLEHLSSCALCVN